METKTHTKLPFAKTVLLATCATFGLAMWVNGAAASVHPQELIGCLKSHDSHGGCVINCADGSHYNVPC